MLSQLLYAFASVSFSLNGVIRYLCHLYVAVCVLLELAARVLLQVLKLVPLLPKSGSFLSTATMRHVCVKFGLVSTGCLPNLCALLFVLFAVVVVAAAFESECQRC
jgi:hypothetical protein